MPLTDLTDQTVDIVRELVRLGELVRLWPHAKAMVPKSLTRLKERLGELHPEGGFKRADDYDLFYRVGVVLSRKKEPLSMGELSGMLEVPLSKATRMVDWLVKSGYMERLADPADRRVVRVVLTKAGRKLYRTIERFLRQRVEQVLRRFSAEERAALAPLLRKIIQALEEREP